MTSQAAYHDIPSSRPASPELGMSAAPSMKEPAEYNVFSTKSTSYTVPRKPLWYFANIMRRRYVLPGLLIGFFLFLMLALRSSSTTIVSKWVGGGGLSVYNRTLGFEKVFAVGFSSRTDKRDALLLASSWSEFDVTWSEGVTPEEIPEKAIPESFGDRNLDPTMIACWRAHLNVLARMVQENIQTALIFEDDVDWDVNIKSQLAMFAEGASQLQNNGKSGIRTASPYGDDWDMLSVGTCHSGPHETGEVSDEQDFYFIRNDSTVPPIPVRSGWWKSAHLIPEILSNDTRSVYATGNLMCLWGYAVSLRGARKILTELSLEGGDGRQIDVMLSDLATSRYIKGYSIWPPLFASHRFAGSASRDSDIKDHDGAYHDEYSANIVYSTMINMPRLVTGSTELVSQWPNDTIPTRGLNEDYTEQVQGDLVSLKMLGQPEVAINGINAKGRLDMKKYHEVLSTL